MGHFKRLLGFGLIVAASSSVFTANSVTRAAPAGPQIQITESRNLGVSAANEAMSIIQISWIVHVSSEAEIKGFDLDLEVTYADGSVEKAHARASGASRRNRFEIPTVHRSRGRSAAEMKSFKVSVTATYSETATKQVSV